MLLATDPGWLNDDTCRAPRLGNPSSEPAAARMPPTGATAAADILLPFPSLHPTPVTAPHTPQTPHRRRTAEVGPRSAAEAAGQ